MLHVGCVHEQKAHGKWWIYTRTVLELVGVANKIAVIVMLVGLTERYKA